MVSAQPRPWRRAAAPAAGAVTAAPAGVAGRSKGSWSAWLRSWSLGSSYGKACGSAGGLAVALLARVRSSPRARAPAPVACDARGVPGPLRARGPAVLSPCLAAAPLRLADSGLARVGCGEPREWTAHAAIQPRRRSPALRALRPPRHVGAPGLPPDSRFQVRPDCARGTGVGPPAGQPQPPRLDERDQPNDHLP